MVRAATIAGFPGVDVGCIRRSDVTHFVSGVAAASRPELFARHARAAIERHVPEARDPSAHWRLGVNVAWVRFPRADGYYGYVALRRHLDWVTGEAGISREPEELSALFLLPSMPEVEVPGYRIRLGELIDGRDRWWPAGESAAQLDERLGALALQLAVKGRAHFRRWPRGER